ncbi:hypothetical protein GCM10010357_11620 [Streptomyces luteireticuli]|uniref:Uncharacterized protein n=1 Tax=Streptomyces luteireticuli TaxID=173858 RepID=A0ABN0YFV5_9ACTN
MRLPTGAKQKEPHLPWCEDAFMFAFAEHPRWIAASKAPMATAGPKAVREAVLRKVLSLPPAECRLLSGGSASTLSRTRCTWREPSAPRRTRRGRTMAPERCAIR